MTRPVRLLLVSPPYHAGVVESAGVWMPLGYAYLAGHARAAGAEVRIYDAMSLFTTHEDICRVVEDFRPTVVAVGAITAMIPDTHIICENVKRLDESIVTVLGNVHPTFCWRELLEQDQNIDIIVRSEGERTLEDLVRALAAGDDLEKVAGIAYRRDGQPHMTLPRPFVQDLDSLTAAWDLLEWERYYYRPSPEGRFAIVSSSRGCQQACTFCSQQKLWEKTWRARRPELFVAELAELRRRHDVRVVMLSDETPTVDRDRWERLLDLLIERDLGVEILMETRVDDVLRDEDLMPKLRRAGVSHLYVGVEAVDQDKLDLFNKNTSVSHSKRAIAIINQADIISETSFVLGAPDETPESMRRTVELAKLYDPDMAFFLALAPWPYADIYAQLEPHIVDRDFRHYNLVEPVIKPEAMTMAELRSELFKATGHFWFHKFEHLDRLSPYKRDYLVEVLRLLIRHSYLGQEMHAMASHPSMPPAVHKMIAEIGLDIYDSSDKGAPIHGQAKGSSAGQRGGAQS